MHLMGIHTGRKCYPLMRIDTKRKCYLLSFPFQGHFVPFCTYINKICRYKIKRGGIALQNDTSEKAEDSRKGQPGQEQWRLSQASGAYAANFVVETM